MFSTPKALRVPSVKRLIVPRTVRRKTNLVPSGRTVAAKSARRAVSTTRKTVR
jgi:hypothetical protein